MYYGEVNIEQENLASFLAVTEELQVHGLSPNTEMDTTDSLVGGQTGVKI